MRLGMCVFATCRTRCSQPRQALCTHARQSVITSPQERQLLSYNRQRKRLRPHPRPVRSSLANNSGTAGTKSKTLQACFQANHPPSKAEHHAGLGTYLFGLLGRRRSVVKRPGPGRGAAAQSTPCRPPVQPSIEATRATGRCGCRWCRCCLCLAAAAVVGRTKGTSCSPQTAAAAWLPPPRRGDQQRFPTPSEHRVHPGDLPSRREYPPPDTHRAFCLPPGAGVPSARALPAPRTRLHRRATKSDSPGGGSREPDFTLSPFPPVTLPRALARRLWGGDGK